MTKAVHWLLVLPLLAGLCAARAAEPAPVARAEPAATTPTRALPAAASTPPAVNQPVNQPVNQAADQPANVSPIPFRRDNAGASGTLAGGTWGVLLVSLVVIGGVLYVRKRLNLNPLNPMQAGAKPRLLRVLESQRLGPRALLSVVEFGGQHYLIAQSEHGISCLVSKPAVDPAAPAVINPASPFAAPGAQT